MDKKQFIGWLKKFDMAWESGDAKAAANLFVKKCNYYENPLDPPLTTKKEIQKVWEEVRKTQRDIRVESKVVMTDNNTCVANFKASFYRLVSNSISNLDGIYIITLSNKNLCEEFHFWWVSKEKKVS